MSDSGPPAQERIQALDAFRALAILGVLLFHFLYRWAPPLSATDVYGFRSSYPFVRFGYLGVEFFFIISGFVIYLTLDRCTSVAQFFVRRFARLYPAYVVAMIVTFVVSNAIGPPEFHHTLREFAFGLSMQSPHFGVPWIDGVYWSLLVEIKFYFWAGLIYLFSRRGFDIGWCLFAVVATVLGRFSETLRDVVFVSQYIPFFTMGLYFYRCYMGAGRGAALLLPAVALVSYAVSWHGSDLAVHGFVAGMVLAFYAFARGLLSWIAKPPLLFFGDISYSLYLVHQHIGVSIVRLARSVLGVPDLVAVLMAMLCTVVLAYAITRYVEHEWKRRITRYAERQVLPWLARTRWYRWIEFQPSR